ncbi:LAGLIDADG family homing endonuclease [Priestia megaterium]|uniref:LAGLIDADG family homing endonuclease n=1 Tax=Priestia megaterium TaxID=1404 RepID=UPI00366D24FC
MSKITKYDQEMLDIIRDPVKWTEHHLGEKPRWYQEQILRHPHHRKVLRCGRRIGKCIEEDQRIINPNTGEYKSVGELYKAQLDGSPTPLLTLNESYQLENSEAFFIEDNGVKDTFAVVTKHGARVVLTGNHPVLTVDGWKEVDALRIGESIATPKLLPIYGQKQVDKHKLRILAYMLAAGRFNKDSISFQARYEGVRETMLESCEHLGINTYRERHKKATIYLINFSQFEFYREIQEKKIPSFIYELDREHLAFFLGSLYSAGGWFFAGRICEIGYATKNRKFALDLKHLLLRFGIQANLLQKEMNDSVYYHLMIYHRSSILLFLEHLSTPERDYEEIQERALEMTSSEPTLPKEVWKYIEEERIAKGLKKADVVGKGNRRYRTEKGISLSNARVYSENLQSAMLHDLINSDVLWEEVVDIVPLGKRQTYDVFVPETHNLVVEDILVHNTWTMCAHMLWVAFTCNGGTSIRKGAACVVATPYDNQARLIFDQLKTFIDNNPVLEESVKSITKNPYVIEFKNKSIIRLFTAGTRSGAEGGSLRGQRADWLYMDEVDYMSDKDFESIYAIVNEAPDRIGTMIASTPTGRRGMFYKTCTQMKLNQDVKMNEKNIYDMSTYDRKSAEGWAEFYFPTMVNPEWGPKMERELRKLFSENAYEHEVLAEFGTEMVGVFNKEYIDEASSIGYNYTTSPAHHGPIAIGVDWDKFGNATQIVVTQYNPFEPRRLRPELGETEQKYGRFQVINRVEIPKGEFTYDNAVKKIIELDAIYNPFAIYCDRGAGEYQIELLRKTLGDRVKGVHLGSSQLVRDPHSREFDKKPLKPFIVNQTVLMLERGQIRIPHRDIDETLARQMTNYQVVRFSAKTGEATYTDVDEHALDGLMFGLLAFINEKPELAATVIEKPHAKTIGKIKKSFTDPFKLKEEVRSTDSELRQKPKNTKVRQRASKGFGWGKRGGNMKMPSRGGW